MKKKYLIVVADYYKDIAKGLIESALKFYPSFKSRELIPEIERLIKEDSI